MTETFRDSKPSEIDAVEREMQQVRRDVQERGSAMVASAKALTDWKHHARTHPWVVLGLAATIGFSLVPRRTRVRHAESSTAGRAVPVVAATVPKQSAGASFASVATRMLRDALLRSGVALIEREFTRQVSDYAARRRQEVPTDDSIST